MPWVSAAEQQVTPKRSGGFKQQLLLAQLRGLGGGRGLQGLDTFGASDGTLTHAIFMCLGCPLSMVTSMPNDQAEMKSAS